ncbi:MAG: glutamate--tRNA ligase, partial [Flavobacteriaceae bacterium]|nr:glutamate--tRNA ligase [Flavobacteriaceae bacterium]
MNNPIRVRFAPSPTGPLHIGGMRTALFNYLFAKKNKGTFVLRIEDTDQKRFVKGAESYITESLSWCKIPYDEGPGKEGNFGPYRQSQRKHLYKRYVDFLLKNNNAYYAFDSAESLEKERKSHEEKGKTFIYNWHNRTKGRLVNSLVLSEKEVQNKIESGDDYVVRFLVPKDETIELSDIVRGKIKIDTNTLDDKVLFKSDGMPTYHLANVVDDHLMKISHVIRGEEWLPSLALHKLLYQSFEWVTPEFAHLPLILKPVGKGKLSKRDGDKLGFPVFPLRWKDPVTGNVSKSYMEEGYLPGAVINFLAMLGWNPGTEQEVFNLEGLISAFNLKRVNKAGARFDPDKTKWFNQQHMLKTNIEDLVSLFVKDNPKVSYIDTDYIELVIRLVKERATFSSDLWGLSHYFFVAPTDYNESALGKVWKTNSKELMTQLIKVLETSDGSSAKALQNGVKSWIAKNEIGFGKVMMPLRVALVGALEGVDVFDII